MHAHIHSPSLMPRSLEDPWKTPCLGFRERPASR